MIPSLEERLLTGSEEDVLHVADLVRHSPDSEESSHILKAP
jgi:hypothetical protein